MKKRSSRRKYLSSIGIGLAAGIAGCSSSTDETEQQGDVPLTEVLNYSASNSFRNPIANSGVVYAPNSDRNIYAIDIESGEESWSYETNEVIGPPLEYGGNSIYTNKEPDNAMYSFSASSGSVEWSIEPDFYPAQPTYSDESLFIHDGGIIAYDATSGNSLWEYDFDGSTYTSSEIQVTESNAINVSEFGVFAVDKSTGTEQWTYEGSGSAVSSSLATTSDRVIYSDDSGSIYILSAVDGSEEKIVSATSDGTVSQILVSDNVMYYDGENGIVAYDIESQEQLWASELSSEEFADGILEGYLFALDFEELKGLNISNGEVEIVQSLTAGTGLRPAVSDNYIVVPDDNNSMLGYEIDS